MRQVHDLTYAQTASRPLKLDLYLPDPATTQPKLVVWIHGGAWLRGDKTDPPLLYLLNGGYALASIQYRFSHEAIFPAQIYDCKGAIRWLRAHAVDYGYIAGRIAVAGASAGGHLSALLGTSGGSAGLEGDIAGHLEQSSQVQAVIDLYGPTNFLDMLSQPSQMDHASADSPESLLLGGPVAQRPQKVRQADPITHINPNTAPFLIIHGDADPLVPYHQSVILHRALSQAGIESTFETIKAGGHGGPQFHDAQRNQMVRDFLARHI